MDENYRILGLEPGADEEAVKQAYRRLAYQYNPDNCTDYRDREYYRTKMEQINRAFDEIMNNLRTGKGGYGNSDRDEFYIYIRRLIQNGEYDRAINQLSAYNNEFEAEWQFLMGIALYYGGYISQSFPYFEKAAQMEPSNKEYNATFSRMRQNRQGNIYSSPYSNEQTYQMGGFCCDPCTVCQCLICMDCCCHH